MSEKLMTVKQVSKYLQMNRMSIYKLARKGEIPAVKIGSEWRFKKELIDNMVREPIGNLAKKKRGSYKRESREGSLSGE